MAAEVIKINQSIATHLKQARAERSWSLDVCSKNTGVSKAMLGQIERGESSPTIAKLWQIATGFNLPLSYFLSPDQNLTTAPQLAQLNSEQGITISTLFPFDAKTNLEVFEIALNSQYQHISQPHKLGVIEHIIVISGEMEFYLDGKWQKLTTGERVKFSADQPHGYRNLAQQTAKFHNIISYPI